MVRAERVTEPATVLEFWLDEIGEAGWYQGGDEIDDKCRERFEPSCAAARQGAYREWLTRPRSALAYLILTDQLPRNIYRGTGLAFASDVRALAAAMVSVNLGHDLKIEGSERQFFYLPFEHAENRQAQANSVSLFRTRMPDDKGGNVIHARVHREIIRRFGRFPARNAALGRASSAAEAAFLAGPGYGGLMEELQG
jgi:uncharacterized protein (DUF924 family)